MLDKLSKRIRKLNVESNLPKYDPSGIRKLMNEDTINLWGGWSPGYKLPTHITNAAKNVVEKHRHYVPFGLPELRKSIGESLEEENEMEVDPMTEILVTTGGIEAEHLAMLTLIDPGDEVIMANPEYMHSYEPNVVLAGGKMIYVTAKENRKFKLDPEDIDKKITKNTKMIVIITPSNPTGAILDKDILEGISDIAIKNDLMVLSDEVFEKIVYDGKKNISIGSLPGMKNRTLTINSFSKSWNMAGFRIGYVTGPRRVINRMANLQIHTTFSVGEISQAAALAALRGPRDWIKDTVKQYEHSRNVLVDGLNNIERIECMKPEGGTCAFFNIEKYRMSTLEFAKYLLKEGNVLVMPTLKHQYGSEAEKYVCIGFCRTEITIKEALKRMEMAL